MTFLTLDHTNNDGAAHRKKTGGGTAFYQQIIREDFPDFIQTLCWNCNEAKRIVGTCPHQKG